MQTQRLLWNPSAGWNTHDASMDDAQLVVFFGASRGVDAAAGWAGLRERYPHAVVVGCSTSGEIQGHEVLDGGMVGTAIRFGHTPVRVARAPVAAAADSRAAGEALARTLAGDGLRAVFVLSDGMQVNGTALVDGLRAHLPADVVITGGLAGDAVAFDRTWVVADQAPASGVVAAVGFYGSALKVGYGSVGGWEPFGPQRVVTRSAGNVLVELDHTRALDLYKRYLGDEARNLPGSALLFPLHLKRDGGHHVVRTILSVDEAKGTMTFAGDIPEGATVQLMRSSLQRLASGAAEAAEFASLKEPSQLAFLVSCVGRKLMMGQRVADEVEAVQEVLGEGTPLVGFYSYGEICPDQGTGFADLHNQTMTITTFAEA